MSIGELTIPFPAVINFFSCENIKKMFKTRTGNFRTSTRCMSLEDNEEKEYYVIQQLSAMMGWIDLVLIHTYLACGKSRRTTVPLSFDDKKEAEKEIDRIEKRLPSIVEKVFQGGELDRIVREVRNI